jgi:hypothetical protein
MNNKKFRWFLALLPGLFFSGCKSEPGPAVEPPPPPLPAIQEIAEPEPVLVPLTGAIIERIKTENAGRLQFYLSTDITLSKEDYAESEEFDDAGAALLTNTHIRDQIIIREKTKGVLLTGSGENDETLNVCFEQDNDNTLSFVQTRTYSEKKFYLNLEGSFDAASGKGQLKYGDAVYQVDYAGEERPYLLVSLTEQELDMPSLRVLPGRSLTDTGM